MTGDLNAPERRALREIVEHGDLTHVDGQAFLIAAVSPATLDTLAAFEAEAEDRESAKERRTALFDIGAGRTPGRRRARRCDRHMGLTTAKR